MLLPMIDEALNGLALEVVCEGATPNIEVVGGVAVFCVVEGPKLKVGF